MNILAPLFEVVSEILTSTDIDINFEARKDYIYWYCGNINELPEDENGHVIFNQGGSLHDWLSLDDLDEDKLNRWVAELTAMLPAPEEEAVDTYENIARTENNIIDRQEDRQI